MNILEEGGNELVCVYYGDLLEKILRVLRNQQTQNPFTISSDRNRLLIDIDAVASQVASLQVDNPLGASANSARAATVNFSPGSKERFPHQIREIRDCLKQQLEFALISIPNRDLHKTAAPNIDTIAHSTTQGVFDSNENRYSQLSQNNSIEEFVASLVTDLQTFRGNTPKLDFTYPFGQYKGLQKQRLSFRGNSSGSRELLKLHKLTITVQNTRDFNPQLREGLENYINVQFGSATESEREDLGYILDDLQADTQSDFYGLKQIVDTQTIGKLQKEALIYYLEFLKDNINTGTSTANAGGAIYLQDLIREHVTLFRRKIRPV